VRVHLSKPNGGKGSIVGPYSIIQGTTYKTLRKPTGAQVAIAWNCDAAGRAGHGRASRPQILD
jgi:hypothetical protein